MVERCPECGAIMSYEISTKNYLCKSCGLYATREQLEELRERKRQSDEKSRRKRQQSEILSWWLSKK